MSFPAILQSEWTKIRTVGSTVWTLASALVVTVGLSALLCGFIDSTFEDMPKQQQLTFDPTMASFAGMTLGQAAVIVFGVLVVGTEYSTGMIRTSLAAVPRRAGFLAGKLTAATALALVVGLVTSFVSFFTGQSLLGDHSIAIGEPNVLRAVVGAGLYMAVLALFSMGMTMILRSSMLALGTLLPLFFLISPILSSVDATRTVAEYLPNQAGGAIMQTVQVTLDGNEPPYGPWGGFAIMVAWALAAVIGGFLVLKNRDA